MIVNALQKLKSFGFEPKNILDIGAGIEIGVAATKTFLGQLLAFYGLAIAFASKVFPVPGSPTSRIPLGIFAPSFINASGCIKNETISSSSLFASVIPATSSKQTFRSLIGFIFDFVLLKFIVRFASCVELRTRNTSQNIIIRIIKNLFFRRRNIFQKS